MPSERLVPQNCVIFYWYKKGRTVKTFFFLAKIAFLDDIWYKQVYCSSFKIKEYHILILLIIVLLNENTNSHIHMIKMSKSTSTYILHDIQISLIWSTRFFRMQKKVTIITTAFVWSIFLVLTFAFLSTNLAKLKLLGSILTTR